MICNSPSNCTSWIIMMNDWSWFGNWNLNRYTFIWRDCHLSSRLLLMWFAYQTINLWLILVSNLLHLLQSVVHWTHRIKSRNETTACFFLFLHKHYTRPLSQVTWINYFAWALYHYYYIIIYVPSTYTRINIVNSIVMYLTDMRMNRRFCSKSHDPRTNTTHTKSVLLMSS